MRKGVFGFQIWFYGIVALLAVWIEQPFLLGAVTGFTMLLERDNWLNHQMLSIFCFLLLFLLLKEGIAILFSVFSITPSLHTTWSGSLMAVVYLILDVVKCIVVLMGYGKMKKGEDVQMPVASAIIEKIYI